MKNEKPTIGANFEIFAILVETLKRLNQTVAR